MPSASWTSLQFEALPKHHSGSDCNQTDSGPASAKATAFWIILEQNVQLSAVVQWTLLQGSALGQSLQKMLRTLSTLRVAIEAPQRHGYGPGGLEA